MLQKQALVLIIGAIVILIVGAAVLFSGQVKEIPEVPALGETVPSAEEPAANPLLPRAPSTASTPKISPTKSTPTAQTGQSSVAILAPQAGEKLVIGQLYTIKWSEEGGTTGFIYLADASTKEVIGWLNSQTSQHDTSYKWDVRDVFLDRYNPSKKPVSVGKYIIGVGFDNKQPPIKSGAFDIIYPSQLTVDSHTVTIKNYTAAPSHLTVKKGSKLIFVNQDAVTHKIVTGNTSFSVAPAGSHAFDTSILFPGLYDFYSEQYPTTARLTINVQ